MVQPTDIRPGVPARGASPTTRRLTLVVAPDDRPEPSPEPSPDDGVVSSALRLASDLVTLVGDGLVALATVVGDRLGVEAPELEAHGPLPITDLRPGHPDCSSAARDRDR